MKYDLNNEVLSNLKDKIDALIENASEFSKNLSADEQYGIMKKIICEGIDKAVLNIYKNEEIKFTEEELKEKKKELEKFVQEYFDKKFSENKAATWEKNC